MNENARAWVEALRSGQYAQTRGALQRLEVWDDLPAGYCCLGVACDMYQQTVGDLSISQEHEVREMGWNPAEGLYKTFNEAGSSLPRAVLEWLGLDTTVGKYTLPAADDGDAELGSLATANDNGATFAEIADIIESEPEGLFA